MGGKNEKANIEGQRIAASIDKTDAKLELFDPSLFQDGGDARRKRGRDGSVVDDMEENGGCERMRMV